MRKLSLLLSIPLVIAVARATGTGTGTRTAPKSPAVKGAKNPFAGSWSVKGMDQQYQGAKVTAQFLPDGGMRMRVAYPMPQDKSTMIIDIVGIYKMNGSVLWTQAKDLRYSLEGASPEMNEMFRKTVEEKKDSVLTEMNEQPNNTIVSVAPNKIVLKDGKGAKYWIERTK